MRALHCLLATLDMTLLVNCKDGIFDSFEQWKFGITTGGEHVITPTLTCKTFNIFPPGVFTSLDLPVFFLDKPTTDLFVDRDFGCVFDMTRSNMRRICIVCKSDSFYEQPKE
jgi:hypothetical protein